MAVRVATIPAGGIARHLDALAALRIAVFRAWPYLYEGDAEYEAWYLADFAKAPGSVVIGALDGERLVGAATASPMAAQKPEFTAPLAAAGLEARALFYFGESVLLPEYRGRGLGHAFFDAREAAARAQGFGEAGFYAVIRAADDPRRPSAYSPLDAFWRARGYAPVEGAVADFPWKETGGDAEIPHPMQFWHRRF